KQRQLLPHAVALLLHSLECLPQQREVIIKKHVQKDIIIPIAKCIGDASMSMGLVTKTTGAMLQTAAEIEQVFFGPDSPYVAQMLCYIAWMHGELEDKKSERESYKRALTIYEAHYGQNHIWLAYILSHLGLTYGSLEDVKKKKEL